MKVKKLLKEGLIALLIIVIISSAVSYLRAPKLDTINSFAMIQGESIAGETIESHQFLGEPLVVYFWATWCPICRIESSVMEDLSQHYRVLSIAVESGDDGIIRHHLKEKGMTLPVINDQEGAIAKRFQISVFPTVLIYDSNGKLAFSESGYLSTIGIYMRIWLGT